MPPEGLSRAQGLIIQRSHCWEVRLLKHESFEAYCRRQACTSGAHCSFLRAALCRAQSCVHSELHYLQVCMCVRDMS